MTKVHICIHISTRNKFHFETLSITLKTTSDKKKKSTFKIYPKETTE